MDTRLLSIADASNLLYDPKWALPIPNCSIETLGLAQVFGERGVHSRSAVGTNALPMNVPVEIEAIVEFEDFGVDGKSGDDWTVPKRP